MPFPDSGKTFTTLPDPMERARRLLMTQYHNSPKLLRYMEILFTPWLSIYQANEDLKLRRSIDTAFGRQLDIIGEIVGQPRIFYGALPLGFFGFYAEAQSLGAGDYKRPGVGGLLRGTGEEKSGDLILSDSAYRNAIRARIFKATSNCSINDMYKYMELLLGRELDLQITEDPALPITYIVYNGEFTLQDRALLSQTMQEIKPIATQMNLSDDSGVIPVVNGGGINNS